MTIGKYERPMNKLYKFTEKKINRHFVLYIIKSESFFLPFVSRKKNMLKTTIQTKLKPVIFSSTYAEKMLIEEVMDNAAFML